MACCLTTQSHYLNQCWPEIIVIHPNASSKKMRKICSQNFHLKLNFQRFYASARGHWVKGETVVDISGELWMLYRCSTTLWLWLESTTSFIMVEISLWRHQMEKNPRYWPFVRGIHRSPVNSPNNGQWRRALMFSLICAWANGRANTRDAGDLRRHRAHYDVTVMSRWCSALGTAEPGIHFKNRIE